MCVCACVCVCVRVCVCASVCVCACVCVCNSPNAPSTGGKVAGRHVDLAEHIRGAGITKNLGILRSQTWRSVLLTPQHKTKPQAPPPPHLRCPEPPTFHEHMTNLQWLPILNSRVVKSTCSKKAPNKKQQGKQTRAVVQQRNQDKLQMAEGVGGEVERSRGRERAQQRTRTGKKR